MDIVPPSQSWHSIAMTAHHAAVRRKPLGYVRVSSDKQAAAGISLDLGGANDAHPGHDDRAGRRTGAPDRRRRRIRERPKSAGHGEVA